MIAAGRCSQNRRLPFCSYRSEPDRIGIDPNHETKTANIVAVHNHDRAIETTSRISLHVVRMITETITSVPAAFSAHEAQDLATDIRCARRLRSMPLVAVASAPEPRNQPRVGRRRTLGFRWSQRGGNGTRESDSHDAGRERITRNPEVLASRHGWTGQHGGGP